MISRAPALLLFSILFSFGYSEGCYKQLLLRFWTGIHDNAGNYMRKQSFLKFTDKKIVFYSKKAVSSKRIFKLFWREKF